ncbi:MAG: hypothetical protein ACHQ1D_00385 [Nitrososphaerales archaeon]
MAKKVLEKEESSLNRDMIKRFGDVISSADRVFRRFSDVEPLSISPSLDLATGGLLPGTLTVISGPAKSGKSTTCLQICKNAIEKNMRVLYGDFESRIRAMNLGGIEGLDLSKIEVVHSPENENDLSAEDFLTIIESYIKNPEYKNSLIVLDSVSALIPRSELDVDPSSTLRASLPKMLSHFYRKIAQSIVKNKITLISISHQYQNTSGFGKLWKTSDGSYQSYQKDYSFLVKKVENLSEDNFNTGLRLEWDIECTPTTSSKNSCVSYIKFGKGIDKVAELTELGTSLSLISKAGAWFECDFLLEREEFKNQKVKFQGILNLNEFISQNPKIYEILNQDIKEMLK